MPEFFVWSTPRFVQAVAAGSALEAAQSFLHQPVSAEPLLSEPPACFVQVAGGADAPREDGSTTEFWIAEPHALQLPTYST